jgi:hypothetical protein
MKLNETNETRRNGYKCDMIYSARKNEREIPQRDLLFLCDENGRRELNGRENGFAG